MAIIRGKVIEGKKGRTKLHGFECYRDIYFKIDGPDVLARFGVNKISELFNGVYTKTINKGGEIFSRSEEMKAEGYFYIPSKTIQGEVIINRDFNLIDQFEITLIANFLQTKTLRILEMSTGQEKYNHSIPGSNIIEEQDFQKRSTPYYPMMDTILLSNLYVKAKMGYVNEPSHSIVIEGMCVGITPNFRKDGYPLVKFTFRDIGWSLGKHVFSTTYPSLKKDRNLEGIAVIGDTKRHE